MPAKKSSKKPSRKSAANAGGGARRAVADRGEQISRMVKELQGSKERTNEFVTNPERVAKQFGVTLSKEEAFAVRFVNGLTLASVVGRFNRALAFFDNNCGCGGGPASW